MSALRALILEDRPADARLLVEKLRDAGFEPDAVFVDDEKTYLEAISPDFDIILADHGLPSFDAPTALVHLKNQGLDVPFIVVSGTMGEDLAVEMMRNGASDYLLKDRLARLGSAVRRALEERTLRRANQKAEATLRESEARYRSLIESTSDVVTRTDSDGIILYQSPSLQPVLGYETQALNGSKIFDLIHPNDKPAAEHRFKEIVARPGTVRRAELRFLHKNGTWIFLEWAGSATETTSGNLQVTFTSRDTSVRRRMEQETHAALEASRESDRLKSIFLANMSHEVRTPLNIIIGYADLISEETQESRFAVPIEAMQNASRRLLHTIHGLLDMARLETGSFGIQPRPIDLATFLPPLLKSHEDAAQRKGLTFTAPIPAPENSIVHFDEYCLEQTISHLVENAIKFTENGSITVASDRTKDGLTCVRISDTGIGIDEAALTKLFRPFIQEHTGSTRPFDGNGLGLALAKRFVELNGGDILVESVPGKGSTFRLVFGLSDAAGETSPTETKRAQTPVVLLVEDDISTQDYMRALLKESYQVSVAATAEEARKHLATEDSVSIILMDIALPGGEDGLSLTRWIRSQKRWQDTPIIAVTAHAFAEDRIRAFSAGCDDFVTKPFDFDKLLALIDLRLGAPRSIAATASVPEATAQLVPSPRA